MFIQKKIRNEFCCYYCGQPGHLKRNCEKYLNTFKGNKDNKSAKDSRLNLFQNLNENYITEITVANGAKLQSKGEGDIVNFICNFERSIICSES